MTSVTPAEVLSASAECNASLDHYLKNHKEVSAEHRHILMEFVQKLLLKYNTYTDREATQKFIVAMIGLVSFGEIQFTSQRLEIPKHTDWTFLPKMIDVFFNGDKSKYFAELTRRLSSHDSFRYDLQSAYMGITWRVPEKVSKKAEIFDTAWRKASRQK